MKRCGRIAFLVFFFVSAGLSPVFGTADSQLTPFYDILAWSSDESQVLAMVNGPQDAEYQYRLIRMDVQSHAATVLEKAHEYNPVPFQDRIISARREGYRPGRVLLAPRKAQSESACPTFPKPVLLGASQQLLLESDEDGVRLILKESLPGIDPAVVVIADLTEQIRRMCPDWFDPSCKADRNLFIEKVYVSPTMQWAIVPVTAMLGSYSTDAAYYCLLVSFPLARESAKLLNICGYRLYRLKAYERAEEQFVRAYYMNPDDAQPLYNLACVCALTGRAWNALDYLKEAIAMDPRYKERARTDPDFDALRNGYLTEAFRAMVE